MSPSAATTEMTALGRSPSLPTFFDNLDSFAEAPEGVAKLRALVLDLAVRGKLVEQDENDEPASELLGRSFAEKKALEESGEIKKQPALSPIEESEVLFDIPSNWSWVRAAEICYPISSGTTPAKSVFQSEPENGVPYLKVYNIRDQGIDFAYKPQYIDQEHHATKMKRSVLVPGMVVLNIVGPPLGKTAIIPDTFPEWNCNQAISFFRLIGDLLPSYFHLYLRAGVFLRNIALIGTAGQDNISVTKCKHIVVPVPPLSEQLRIVSKVDGLMSLCDELESRGSERVRLRERASRSCLARLVSAGVQPSGDRQAAKACTPTEDLSSAWQRLSDHFEVLYDTPETLTHLRQSILQLAVQGKLVPQDPNDEPACRLLEAIRKQKAQDIQDSKKGLKSTAFYKHRNVVEVPFEIPPNWEWANLDELSHFTNGKAHEQLVDDQGQYVLINSRFVSTSGETKKFASEILTPMVVGDLAMVMSDVPNGRALARCFIVDKNDHYTLNQRIGGIRLIGGILPEFAFIVLNRNRHLLSFNDGKKQTNLRKAQILSCPFPLPPLAEQKRIVAKVDQLLSQCDNLSARLRERQSTTQQLLTATIHGLLSANTGE